jgi:hypothetical protein
LHQHTGLGCVGAAAFCRIRLREKISESIPILTMARSMSVETGFPAGEAKAEAETMANYFYVI